MHKTGVIIEIVQHTEIIHFSFEIIRPHALSFYLYIFIGLCFARCMSNTYASRIVLASSFNVRGIVHAVCND